MFIPGIQWLNVDLPYSEYWVPLIIGMGVGVFSLVVGRVVMGCRSRVVAPYPGDKKADQEFDPFIHGSPSDQRKGFRRSGNAVPVYYATAECKGAPKVGWVFDRSTGGLGLVLNEEWPTDFPLAVRPVNAPESAPWVDVVVKNSRKTEEGFETGCQFVKTPPWSVLLLFG